MDEPVVRRRVVSQDSIEANYNQAEQKLLQFVAEKVELMNSNLLFRGAEEASFYSLNKSLMEYESVQIALTSLYVQQKYASQVASEKYDDYYAEKFKEEKIKQASLKKDAQFTSAKEIEMAVRSEHKTELSKLKAEVLIAEGRRSFCERLTESWKQYAFILSSLSKNAQAEAGASRISTDNPNEFPEDTKQF